MDRKDFLKSAGLAAAALFVRPEKFVSRWDEDLDAQDFVSQALAYALANGAIYADARIGECTLVGYDDAHEAIDLLKDNLIGLRICTNAGWRNFILADLKSKDLEARIKEAMAAPIQNTTPNKYMLSAHFCQDKIKAYKSTDSQIESMLNTAQIRYAQTQALPSNSNNIHFCDLLIQH